jgi:type III restriction enzyme
MQTHYQNMAQNLKKTLVFNNGIMPLGLLRSCMEYALNDNTKIDGVFQTVKEKFKVAGGRDLLATVTRIYDFRNTRVAHQEKEVTDAKEAQQHLVGWIKGLKTLTEAGQ